MANTQDATVENAKTSLVECSVVAKLFGMTTQRVHQLAAEGIISVEKSNRTNRYNLPLVTRQYIKFLSDKAYGREKSTEVSALENDKLTAEADYKRAKARMAQLSLNELDGKLHRAEDVEAVLTNLIYAIRGTLLALPGRLAADTARCKTAAQAADCIKAEVYAALREVSKFRYDKEEFKGRVKERQGWESEPLENDEP